MWSTIFGRNGRKTGSSKNKLPALHHHWHHSTYKSSAFLMKKCIQGVFQWKKERSKKQKNNQINSEKRQPNKEIANQDYVTSEETEHNVSYLNKDCSYSPATKAHKLNCFLEIIIKSVKNSPLASSRCLAQEKKLKESCKTHVSSFQNYTPTSSH